MIDEVSEEIGGAVESIIFASTDGRFCVFRLKPDGQQGQVTVTVNGPAPLVGQQLLLKGSWTVHPRFGEQFRAVHMAVTSPTSLAGIERFLASGAVKGIGPVVAKRLVKAFGLETLKIIEFHPKRLREVPGIGAKTAEKIAAGYREHAELRDIMLWLETHGASGIFAGRIFQKYGSFAMEVLQKEPYRLAYDISGIGFLTADTIALAAGLERDSVERLEAGIDYVLSRISSDGHCCVPETVLLAQAGQMLQVDAEAVRDGLQRGMDEGRFLAETLGDDTLVYPGYLYTAERYTAMRLLYLQEEAEPLSVEEPLSLVKEWERHSLMTLAPGQRRAVCGAIENGVFVLTGGPGTGKTTIVRAVLDIFEDMGLEVLLGAPTGRAAKRLEETTGRKAATVHRLLEAKGGDDERLVFGRDEAEPLEADAVILDEVSMMDIVLMRYFLRAVPDGCHLILVGDADQLPAVGPGMVLKDILRSDAVPSLRLTEIFRQAEESAIVVNAHAINHGRMPGYAPGSDFEFLRMHSAEETEQQILELCTRILPAQGYDILNEVQVLSPMYKQVCGIDSLNHRLQAMLNPPEYGRSEWKSGAEIFREGDKVMQMKNNYTKNVFNGDIGFIDKVDEEKITVRYSEELYAEYTKGELGELRLAYAMSVHKSQGSEYPVVVLPLVPGHRVMLQRNLLYTAVTRARQRVIILGSLPALQTAVENDRTKKRFTLLAERLNHLL